MGFEGKTIGTYVVGKEVGKGATGTVFVGFDPQTKDTVAIKVMKKKGGSKKIMLEAETMKKLGHEHMVKLYTVIEDPANWYLILEYAGKGELFAVVKGWKRDQRERNTFHYFHQLLIGLQYLHNAGFAHRDLKLENLLLSHDGVLKIADFGVTKELTFNPMKTCCGSPDYIAPEILTDSEGYDGKLADIWSCGVILYAMLCGEFPFEKTEDILKAHYKAPKWFPKLARDTTLDGLLVVDTKKRLQSTRAVLATSWCQSFKTQRHAFGVLLDITQRYKKTAKKGGLLMRLMLVRVMVMVKVVRALSRASVKGVSRNISLVSQDRLKYVLRLVNSFVRVAPATVQMGTGSTHEVDWKALGRCTEYRRHAALLGEVQRGSLQELDEDTRLAVLLNLYHVLLIHGFANAGKHLCHMSSRERRAFFDSTAYIIGYMSLSLNDIKHGIFRCNGKRPGHWSKQLDPLFDQSKMALALKTPTPLVHLVLSALTKGSPTIRVFKPETVHEQISVTASEYLSSAIMHDTKTKAVIFPACFKRYRRDFGKDGREPLDFVLNLLADQQQREAISGMIKGQKLPTVRYGERSSGFAWAELPEFEAWDREDNRRFVTAVEERHKQWEASGCPRPADEIGWVASGDVQDFLDRAKPPHTRADSSESLAGSPNGKKEKVVKKKKVVKGNKVHPLGDDAPNLSREDSSATLVPKKKKVLKKFSSSEDHVSASGTSLGDGEEKSSKKKKKKGVSPGAHTLRKINSEMTLSTGRGAHDSDNTDSCESPEKGPAYPSGSLKKKTKAASGPHKSLRKINSEMVLSTGRGLHLHDPDLTDCSESPEKGPASPPGSAKKKSKAASGSHKNLDMKSPEMALLGGIMPTLHSDGGCKEDTNKKSAHQHSASTGDAASSQDDVVTPLKPPPTKVPEKYPLAPFSKLIKEENRLETPSPLGALVQEHKGELAPKHASLEGNDSDLSDPALSDLESMHGREALELSGKSFSSVEMTSSTEFLDQHSKPSAVKDDGGPADVEQAPPDTDDSKPAPPIERDGADQTSRRDVKNAQNKQFVRMHSNSVKTRQPEIKVRHSQKRGDGKQGGCTVS